MTRTVSAEDPDIAAALERGVELFNRQQFFEAHEIWEEQWIDSQMEDRHLLQGLIQIAAGFYKLQIGMPTGTAKLLEKGVGHLKEVPHDFYGLDVAGIIAAAEQWRAAAKVMIETSRTDFDKEALPKLERVCH